MGTWMPTQTFSPTNISLDVGWNPGSWMCTNANDAIMLWLRLYILSNCISHPCHTFIRCLSTSFVVDGHMEAHYIVTPTSCISPDWGQLAEILVLVGVGVGEQMTLPHYSQGCTSFQTLSHIHLIHASCLRNFLLLCFVIWMSTNTITPTRVSPGLREQWANNATMPWFSLSNLSNWIPHPCHTIQGIWAPSIVVDGHIWMPTHTVSTTNISSD